MAADRPEPEADEPVNIPLESVDALRAHLQVDPDAAPVAGEGVIQEAVAAAEEELAIPEDTTNEG